MKIGMAADHGGFELKTRLAEELLGSGHIITDFGADSFEAGDDYPDFVIPLAKAVASGKIERGIAVCGSGVGAAIAANKTANVRAALIVDCFSARQGVEDDDMNIICLGGRVVGYNLALDLIKTFLSARYLGSERFQRRLDKIKAIEHS